MIRYGAQRACLRPRCIGAERPRTQMPIYLSIYVPIYLCTYLSINPIHPSIHSFFTSHICSNTATKISNLKIRLLFSRVYPTRWDTTVAWWMFTQISICRSKLVLSLLSVPRWWENGYWSSNVSRGQAVLQHIWEIVLGDTAAIFLCAASCHYVP